MIQHQLINGDCIEYLRNEQRCWDTIFADPPDNIGLKYATYKDMIKTEKYFRLLREWIDIFIQCSKSVWFSYNAKWFFEIGNIVQSILCEDFLNRIEARQCIQRFTFGQHNQRTLGNNYRPLLWIRRIDAPLFPDEIRVKSWRQEHGDPRADPRGRVPGDVFDFPRVTGNSKQRRNWHPTQLHEGLVERCIRLTTPQGGTVLDPFAGTGTTLLVCKRLEMPCTLIEIDENYCNKIFEEHRQSDLARGSLTYLSGKRLSEAC